MSVKGKVTLEILLLPKDKEYGREILNLVPGFYSGVGVDSWKVTFLLIHRVHNVTSCPYLSAE